MAVRWSISQPKAGVIEYPTFSWSLESLKHCTQQRQHHLINLPHAATHASVRAVLTLHKFPTTSSSAGAKVAFTYKNNDSPSATFSTLLKYATTLSNFCPALMRLSSRLGGMGGADPPTGLKRTTIFWSVRREALASARASVEDFGRAANVSEAVIVRGMVGEGEREGMLAAEGEEDDAMVVEARRAGVEVRS